MKKIKINEEKAELDAKEALIFLDYPSNIKIDIHLRDDGIPFYMASYENISQGKPAKYIMPINKRNFEYILKIGLEIKGYTVDFVTSKISDDAIKYEAMVSVVTYNNAKRVKRRK